MLNVCQLMIAFWVDWLMITEALPCPAIVAAPPTTVPPSGPAATRATPSANSAVAVSNRLHRQGRRGYIVNVPRPSAQDREEPLVPAGPASRRPRSADQVP